MVQPCGIDNDWLIDALASTVGNHPVVALELEEGIVVDRGLDVFCIGTWRRTRLPRRVGADDTGEPAVSSLLFLQRGQVAKTVRDANALPNISEQRGHVGSAHPDFNSVIRHSKAQPHDLN